MGPELMLTERH